ncbi:helix-turn-helix domain-containing protein [Mycobacterium sp. CBMA293]|uniref:IclR family transcriptional regulator n=1 Tax=unclassified Mycolicibacterium TaxID=2636767 RepID=UPI0012DE6162|nr:MULTISPECIES: IclR family transcriptional regulator C-terminal domain-containing protein [unclassified Mycolicibacterium]MUL48881.1 helix-turn-helix domain-containing protein [Mycolicibacterium sp. CBMA 360]MUL62492.1 helix-turn-helix domain-containing protein [Mycolicibacterium sp. CBMA 335]MUL74183.1 helix-turn-helix domain-containing protein [Mycolicibacterium sp. CBMA 311]MUL96877.1 helix-turn-helix domain-containing protein [Mycolicibacterium sp. CBMA 230]MUM03924.1 IclR family transcr
MSPADGALSGRQPKAVQSALQVLEAVALAGTGVTAKDIAEHLSMPSATTYRLLNLLVADGYIVRLPDLSGFALGPRMGQLIDAAVSPTVCTTARDTLTELRLSVRFGVHLFCFTNTSVRLADADGEYPPPTDESVLNRHLHASAVGKLLLAEKDDANALLGATLAALTDRTVTSKSLLAEQLTEIREHGSASQTGELQVDAACVAVPVRSAAGNLVAAVAMSGRAEQDQLLHRQIPVLQGYATQLAPLLA